MLFRSELPNNLTRTSAAALYGDPASPWMPSLPTQYSGQPLGPHRNRSSHLRASTVANGVAPDSTPLGGSSPAGGYRERHHDQLHPRLHAYARSSMSGAGGPHQHDRSDLEPCWPATSKCAPCKSATMTNDRNTRQFDAWSHIRIDRKSVV